MKRKPELGMTVVPVPESATACGEPLAPSKMLSVAVRAPAAAGENVMKKLQLPPATMLVLQLLEN
jgi:hypothetical protein